MNMIYTFFEKEIVFLFLQSAFYFWHETQFSSKFGKALFFLFLNAFNHSLLLCVL